MEKAEISGNLPQEAYQPGRARFKEISLIVVLTLVVVLFTGGIAFGVQRTAGATGEASEGVLIGGVREIRIEAQQWYFTPGTIKVNPGERVRFIVVSKDIMHGFAINELGINLALSPGGSVVQEVTIPNDLPPGTYTMYCSIFCGIGHPYMKGSILIGNPGVELAKFLPYLVTLYMAAIFAASMVFAGRKRKP